MDDQCANWSNLDGSYTLPFQACTRWGGSFTTPILEMKDIIFNSCNTYYWWYTLGITVQFSGSDIVASVNLLATMNVTGSYFLLNENHVFKTAVTLPVDCCNWTASGIPYDSRSKGSYNDGFGGDLTTATFNISASIPGC